MQILGGVSDFYIRAGAQNPGRSATHTARSIRRDNYFKTPMQGISKRVDSDAPRKSYRVSAKGQVRFDEDGRRFSPACLNVLDQAVKMKPSPRAVG
jgi:hypothetical protein